MNFCFVQCSVTQIRVKSSSPLGEVSKWKARYLRTIFGLIRLVQPSVNPPSLRECCVLWFLQEYDDWTSSRPTRNLVQLPDSDPNKEQSRDIYHERGLTISLLAWKWSNCLVENANERDLHHSVSMHLVIVLLIRLNSSLRVKRLFWSFRLRTTITTSRIRSNKAPFITPDANKLYSCYILSLSIVFHMTLYQISRH